MTVARLLLLLCSVINVARIWSCYEKLKLREAGASRVNNWNVSQYKGKEEAEIVQHNSPVE